MKPVVVPEGASLPHSIAACLASILETEDVPIPPADHPEPWTVWRVWLAERGLGLVGIRDPQAFNWPGPWIAVLRGERAAVAYGSPPGLAWTPVGGEFADVVEGYVVAPHDVDLWTPRERPRTRTEGRVEGLVLAPDAEAPVTLVEHAVAHAGRGLEGDRYFDDRGTFSNRHSLGHDLTLIEAEACDGVIAPEQARRNVITRGIDLNGLVGRRFRVGEVECIGRRLCEPCALLERLTEPGILRALVHIGGLRADILSDGTIRVGDTVTSGRGGDLRWLASFASPSSRQSAGALVVAAAPAASRRSPRGPCAPSRRCRPPRWRPAPPRNGPRAASHSRRAAASMARKRSAEPQHVAIPIMTLRAAMGEDRVVEHRRPVACPRAARRPRPAGRSC